MLRWRNIRLNLVICTIWTKKASCLVSLVDQKGYSAGLCGSRESFVQTSRTAPVNGLQFWLPFVLMVQLLIQASSFYPKLQRSAPAGLKISIKISQHGLQHHSLGGATTR